MDNPATDPKDATKKYQTTFIRVAQDEFDIERPPLARMARRAAQQAGYHSPLEDLGKI